MYMHMGTRETWEPGVPPQLSMSTTLEGALGRVMIAFVVHVGSTTACQCTHTNRIHKDVVYAHVLPSGPALAWHTGRDIRDITDTIVFESFARAVQEDGIYRRYVEHAQIAAVVGNTLFVHGAVSPKSVGFVPCPRRTRHRRNAEHEIHALDDGVSLPVPAPTHLYCWLL